ncbi:TetR/AcrR family transcriptional regulator [Ktedonobacter racemifer]|uniref:Transcriptional regulator, TetR family n=1 Tax=Ktedonobacter racemifer DSM 44963 TaxID=485913 RepID=D6TUD2_KTERA|nr:TetR family transcriptional regulator [Ktedonobacter racemifer]EFH84000.1 transcriptional regulator, TetR family [Ktedonobacter racemifer DSM 44963]
MVSSPRDESQPMSLRERKKRLAQATIEEAALQLFQQKGYERTSIQDIADVVMMSPRTFFRYFASKEDVLLEPMRAIQSEGLRFLQHAAPTESPHAALRATFEYLARLHQQQRASFLTLYHVVMQVPSLASIYVYALMKTEPSLCEALYSRLKAATNRQEIRFLVAIYMAALRVALEEWLEQEAQGDLVSLLRGYLDDFSSLSHHA